MMLDLEDLCTLYSSPLCPLFAIPAEGSRNKGGRYRMDFKAHKQALLCGSVLVAAALILSIGAPLASAT